MSAPFERDEEPTATFVPLWDDEDGAELPERVIVVSEAFTPEQAVGPADEESGVPDVEDDVHDEDEDEVEDLPTAQVVTAEQVAVPPVVARDEPSPGTLRPVVPEPVVEARRPPRPAPSPPRASSAQWALSKLRAATGLLVMVLVSGVLLAAAIGITVVALAFVLRKAVGG